MVSRCRCNSPTDRTFLGGVREVQYGAFASDISLSIGNGRLNYSDPHGVGSLALWYFPGGVDLTQAGANDSLTLQIIGVSGEWFFHPRHTSSEGAHSYWSGAVTPYDGAGCGVRSFRHRAACSAPARWLSTARLASEGRARCWRRIWSHRAMARRRRFSEFGQSRELLWRRRVRYSSGSSMQRKFRHMRPNEERIALTD